MFQGVATGLLGRSALGGGLATAGLGLALHFTIATSIVAAYMLASRRYATLTKRPVACGLLYGVLVYFFMYEVVLPLSLVRLQPATLPVFLNNILIHALGVGLPSALFARRAPREGTPHFGEAACPVS